MPVRLHYKIQVGVSSTSAEENDLGNAKIDLICDSQPVSGVQKYVVQAGATDVPILPLGATTRFLYLRTVSKDPTLQPVGVALTLHFGGTTATFSLVPLPEAGEGHALFSTDGLTAVTVSNPSSGQTPVDMEVTVFAVGG